MSTALYDHDFYAWTEEQAAALRRAGETRINAPVDWAHVAEEIEDLGHRQKSAADSLLRQIMLHLLKLQLTRVEGPRAHWRKEVGNFRDDLHKELEDSPSHPEHLPADCPYALSDLLDIDWWPVNRFGLD